MVKLEEKDLGNDLTEVRKKLNKLKFKEGINILALQPGVGKTTKIKEYLKDKDKWLVTVPNYNLIESEYKEIIEMDGVSYWKGFDRLCPKYLKNDSKVKFLRDNQKLYPSVICGKCTSKEKNECRYKQQFNESNKVITVSAFYNTPRFYEKGKFKFDIAIIDEELSGYDELRIDDEKINKAIELIRNYLNYEIAKGETDHSIIPPFREIFKNKDFYSLESDYPIGDIIFSGVKAEKEEALEKVFKRENWEDYKIMADLDFLKLKKWFYYYFIYGEDRAYGDPHIYRLFDLARQGVKVVFSDASFSKRIFSKLVGRYIKEEQKLSRRILFKEYIIKDEDYKDFELPYEIEKIRVFMSSIQDEKTFFYRMWTDSNFHKSNFQRREVPEEMLDFYKKINRKYYKPAIISYSSIWTRYFDLTKFSEFAYFWNIRGINKFKNEEIIIIVGTPVPDGGALLDDYNNLFIEDYEKRNKIPVFSKKKSGLDGFEFYQRYKIDSEIYQAVHRIRPFNNPNKTIYVFGFVPEELIKEFNVNELESYDPTIEFFENNFNGVYPVSLARSIIEYHWLKSFKLKKDWDLNENKQRKITDAEKIAKAFKFYKIDKSKGYNTPLINAILKNKIKPEVIYKIDGAIKDGASTVKEVKDKCGKLNINDEHLEHFIHYAENRKRIELP